MKEKSGEITTEPKMDATKKPLLIPPEFSTYAEKHGIFEIYEVHFLFINIAFAMWVLKQILLKGPPRRGKREVKTEIE